MPSSKGEEARRKILKAVFYYESRHHVPPRIDEVQQLTGIRSFDALGRHLKELKRQGVIEQHHVRRIRIKDIQLAENIMQS